MSVPRPDASSSGAIELARRIAAPPEVVFSYFIDAERYRLWQGVDAELDPRPGGLFRIRMTGHSGQVVRGEYLEVDSPKRLVLTWGYEGNAGLGPGDSTVEVLLEPDGGDTLLTVRHTGLPSETACRFHTWGWDTSLDRLTVVATGRDAGPNPFGDF